MKERACLQNRCARLLLATLLAWIWLSAASAQNTPPSTAGNNPGLLVSFFTPGMTGKPADVVVSPNLWLYVPQGQAATPFLPGAGFEAVWEGFLTSEAGGECAFRAELRGQLSLQINDDPALEMSGAGTLVEPAKPVQLKRGRNTLRARFTNPGNGDALLRVEWKPKDSFFQVIPKEVLSFRTDSPELAAARQLQEGRELFLEFRCAKCHTLPSAAAALPELGMDAPEFAGMAARRNPAWLAKWILDPSAVRPTAHMPKLLSGQSARADAADLVAFLSGPEFQTQEILTTPKSESAPAGRRLFNSLHCDACHSLPGAKPAEAAKLSLSQVNEKFPAGALIPFLLKPEAHYAWTAMPNFRLTDGEAGQLAAYLVNVADPATQDVLPTNADASTRGKKLLQTAGCLNCHKARVENQFTVKPLDQLPAANWQKGCLAGKAEERGRAPEFAFTEAQRAALATFGATDRSSLLRHVPAEFAERQTRLMNCRSCHGQYDGFPPLDSLGGKLRPEWSRAFIAGEIKYEPRPWLEARMPSFRQRAESLSQGLAMLHGFPAQTPPEPPIDKEAAGIGQKLASAIGGFSCGSCHGFSTSSGNQVFQTPGINLAYANERLLRAYFMRWVRNPQTVDPASKMPVFFSDEGQSPLADILGGDANKQILSLWNYLRQGNQMTPPPTQ